MKIEITPGTEQAVLKRALWLAFGASRPMGLGALHADVASKVTEDALWDALNPSGEWLKGDVRSFDYIAGRMVKARRLSWEDGAVIVPDDLTPNPEYQSWCGSYPTYEALIESARASLESVEGTPRPVERKP